MDAMETLPYEPVPTPMPTSWETIQIEVGF